MPPFPGEERLATVYADLHYYFAQPTVRPALHRFDKGSYFYLYYNSTRHTSRIEVANNPGTPDQDAFNGFLDTCRIVHSHHFPTRVTIVVDATNPRSHGSPTSPRPTKDPDEWRLASADPKDAGKSKYRIHTIDVYFWAQEDAKLIIDLLKRLLTPSQLDIDEPQEQEPDQPHDTISPVVQNLEKVAISDPAYQNVPGEERESRAPPNQTLNAPPPPPSAQQQPPQQGMASPSPASITAQVGRHSSVRSEEPSTNYAPLAYNPAAPAAPEPIAHREDTPPPVDAADGTGLATAAVHDETYRHQPPAQSWSGAPPPAASPYSHYGSPPPAAASLGSQVAQQAHHTSPTSSALPVYSPGPDSRRPSVAAQNYVPPPPDPNAHIFGPPPVQTPGSQFYDSIHDQPHKPLQHVQPQYADYLTSAAPQTPPVGGYSQYQYGQAQQPAASPYDIHSQVYRPTEAEHHSHHKPKPTPAHKSKFDERAERVEKGVGRLFKKIEKKIG